MYSSTPGKIPEPRAGQIAGKGNDAIQESKPLIPDLSESDPVGEIRVNHWSLGRNQKFIVGANQSVYSRGYGFSPWHCHRQPLSSAPRLKGI